jgi:quercetin dioxygenase-like cupin family protein
MTKRRLGFATGGVLATLAGVAMATPGANVVSSLVFARAAFTRPVDLMFKITEDHEPGTQVLHVLNAQDTVVQQIVFGPGGHTGWHSHPGPVVVLVAQGS